MTTSQHGSTSDTLDVLRLLRNKLGADFEDLSELVDVNRKSVIFKPGDEEEHIYIIQQGRVRIYRCHPSSKNITLSILDGNELFGEMALFYPSRRINCAVTLEDSRIYVIPVSTFRTWMAALPELSHAMLLLMAERRRLMEQTATEFALMEVSQRVARAILRLFARYNESNDETPTPINMRITQNELASIAGTTRESATFQLNKFRRDGLIEISDRKIVLKNIRGLQQIVESS